MIVYKATCVEDYTLEAENGDKLELLRGRKYTVSR
jgi:hypothetical protein